MLRLTCIAAAFLALAAATPAGAFDRSAWVADFEQMKAAITRRSPNLEWAAERGLDLPAMERRAREGLDAAADDPSARSALERFVRNFADGHMELSWPSPASPRPAPTATAPAPRPTCAGLGYRGGPDTYAVGSRLAGYAPVAAGAGVPAGLATVDGRRVGVLRIGLFAPSEVHCDQALVELGRPTDGPCDDACAEVVSRRADDRFLAEIAQGLRALGQAGAEVLLLDVAGNGGGNDSSVAVARMIGGANVLSPSMVFVRGADRAKDLAEDEAVVRAGPTSGARPADLALARGLASGYAAARDQAMAPCDLSPLWRGEPAGCSNLVRGGFYAGGITPLDLPAGTPPGEWAEVISATSRFRYSPELWTGPILVLVDGNSASSTELLAAMLQDAGRAVIVGSPTFGAGCGWTLPRQDVVLKNSGGRLSLPDCARLRQNGRNEVDGIEPDILVGFRTYDSPRQRGERLAARLPAAVRMALGKARP